MLNSFILFTIFSVILFTIFFFITQYYVYRLYVILNGPYTMEAINNFTLVETDFYDIFRQATIA